MIVYVCIDKEKKHVLICLSCQNGGTSWPKCCMHKMMTFWHRGIICSQGNGLPASCMYSSAARDKLACITLMLFLIFCSSSVSVRLLQTYTTSWTGHTNMNNLILYNTAKWCIYYSILWIHTYHVSSWSSVGFFNHYTWKQTCAIPDDITWQQRQNALVTYQSVCNMEPDSISSQLHIHVKHLCCKTELSVHVCCH